MSEQPRHAPSAPERAPRASVVVTTFRTRGDALHSSLTSVLTQTERRLELVVVVDGTPRRDERLVLAELAADPRLVLVEPGRVGRGRALDLGIRAATAPLVAIQDADDESHPERLARQLAVLDADPRLALLGAGTRWTRRWDDHADWTLPPERAEVHAVGDELLVRNPFTHSSVVVRREWLDAVGGYGHGLRRHFDYDLYLRLRRAGAALAQLDQPLVLRRRHEDQAFERPGAAPQRVWATYRLQASHAIGDRSARGAALLVAATVGQSIHLLRSRRRHGAGSTRRAS